MNAAVSRAPASATAAAAISEVSRPWVKARSTPPLPPADSRAPRTATPNTPPASRAVRLTGAGRRGLAATFGLSLDDAPPRVRAGGATASRSRSE
jgi:hypothetical protein